MEMALIGLAGSGKTTLFNALTGGPHQASGMGRAEGKAYRVQDGDIINFLFNV